MLNPKTTEIQFNGTIGAIAISLGLPVLITTFGLIFNSTSTFKGGLDVDLDFSVDRLVAAATNITVWKAYLAYFFGLVILDQIVPGKHIKGVKLRDNTQLTYKINGLSFILLITAIEMSRFYYLKELPELRFVYENQLELTLVCTLFSFFLAVFVYIISFIPLTKPNGVGTKERILAEPGNTGNIIYDWFIGRELNPRIGSWDIKLFCELKPGLLLWLFINLSCMHHQWETTGKITDSLLCINFLQGVYIFDGVLNEEGLLTMMDVVTDGFGFMLAFGDLALVPWSYSLQARYLAMNQIELGKNLQISIILLTALGFFIFRAANQEKSDFKKGRLNHMKSIKTKTGSYLLVSGWWGLSRHINYMGDWFIGLSWCLTTGFNTPITYYYAIYFAALLIHRQIRDDEKCSKKYQESWEEYKALVPYKIIPYIY